MCDTSSVTEPAPKPREGWEGQPDPVHANVVQVSGGPFDVMLVFGEQDLTSRTEEGRVTRTREVARVSMSWAHLKSMVPLLAKMVASYEQQVGEVPSPGFDQMWKE